MWSVGIRSIVAILRDLLHQNQTPYGRITIVPMRRCRRRSLTADQHHAIWYALMGEKDEPWRNQYTRETDNCVLPEQLVSMGLMRHYWEVPGYRCYHVTERGADAVGMWLPED
jgi:hypothetical protein